MPAEIAPPIEPGARPWDLTTCRPRPRLEAPHRQLGPPHVSGVDVYRGFSCVRCATCHNLSAMSAWSGKETIVRVTPSVATRRRRSRL